VDELVPEVRVGEQRMERMNVYDSTVAQCKALRVVHPAVDRDDHERSDDAGGRDRDARQEMRPRRHAVPAVDVDADEDRFEKEREPLDGESEPEHATERGREIRPEQTHLKAENCAGHHAGREQCDEHLRPAPGQNPEDLISGAQEAPLDEEDQRGKGDAEADQRDMDHKRHGLHLPGLKQILLQFHSPNPSPWVVRWQPQSAMIALPNRRESVSP
jgi:hypothetical protein